MKALKLIPKYLWQYKFVIALLFVFTAVFALIAYLYQMAVEAILYAFALCFTIIIILVAIHFYLYCKKHFERIRLLNYPLTLQLPIPQNLTEAELYAVIGKIRDGNDRVVINEEERRYLELPKSDELYKVMS